MKRLLRKTRLQHNSNISSHVHTRKIVCVARVKCARCGVLCTQEKPLQDPEVEATDAIASSTASRSSRAVIVTFARRGRHPLRALKSLTSSQEKHRRSIGKPSQPRQFRRQTIRQKTCKSPSGEEDHSVSTTKKDIAIMVESVNIGIFPHCMFQTKQLLN